MFRVSTRCLLGLMRRNVRGLNEMFAWFDETRCAGLNEMFAKFKETRCAGSQ
jgi:hypothetical protein